MIAGQMFMHETISDKINFGNLLAYQGFAKCVVIFVEHVILNTVYKSKYNFDQDCI